MMIKKAFQARETKKIKIGNNKKINNQLINNKMPSNSQLLSKNKTIKRKRLVSKILEALTKSKAKSREKSLTKLKESKQ